MSQVPAGWYADPLNASQRRYWDGTQWTQNTAPAATPPASVEGYGHAANGVPAATYGQEHRAGYAPATQFAPTTQHPVAQQPVAQQPVAQQPAAGYAPATQFAPATQQPVAQQPVAQQPGAGYAPTTQQPIAQQPAAGYAPATQQPVAQQPAAGYAPATQQPSAGYAPATQFAPTTQQPVAQQPAAGYAPATQFAPATQQPAAPATSAYGSPQFAPAPGTPRPSAFSPITEYTPEPARYSYNAAPVKKKGGAGKVVALLVGGIVLIAGVGYVANSLVNTVATPAINETSALALDTSAKSDATSLGSQLNLYYVDHSGAPPAITMTGSNYVINIPGEEGIEIRASKGVALGGVGGTGTTDWCVWVTAAEGQVKDFQYSSVSGLGPGHC